MSEGLDKMSEMINSTSQTTVNLGKSHYTSTEALSVLHVIRIDTLRRTKRKKKRTGLYCGHQTALI